MQFIAGGLQDSCLDEHRVPGPGIGATCYWDTTKDWPPVDGEDVVRALTWRAWNVRMASLLTSITGQSKTNVALRFRSPKSCVLLITTVFAICRATFGP